MSVAEMMALFRKRGDAVRALQNVVLVPSLNETTEKVFDNLVHVVDVSHELHQLCLQNHNLAEKLLSLWKRTHWPLCTRETMLGEAAEWRAAASKGPVEVNAIVPDHHDYARINLYEMVPFESINDADIRTIGELDERRYLLVRVLALPIVRQHGYQFLAEDRLGNPFWVFSSSLRAPSHEDLTFVDELARVGTVFAIISPILHMYVFNWEPQLTCSYNQSRVIQIEDLSNSLLRVTPWFEEPCTTALDWKQRGNARFCAQRFHAAMECFTHGIALESTIDLLANRAAAYLKTGNWEGAVADCDAVLARDDAHRKCVMRRAAALTKLERHDEAFAAWTRATFLTMDSPTDKAECAAGMAKAIAARHQAEGNSFMFVIDPVTFKPRGGDPAAYMDPSVRRASNGARGVIARKLIPRDTRILVEGPLASAASTLQLADELFMASNRDTHKRAQLTKLSNMPHIVAQRSDQSEECFDPLLMVVRSSAIASSDGLKLFYRLSFFNHACEANCRFQLNPLTVFTNKDIRRGEELTIAFVPKAWSGEVRRQQMQLRMIECNCARCTRRTPNDKAPQDSSESQDVLPIPNTSSNSNNNSTRKH